jgi:hypothetical protein
MQIDPQDHFDLLTVCSIWLPISNIFQLSFHIQDNANPPSITYQVCNDASPRHRHRAGQAGAQFLGPLSDHFVMANTLSGTAIIGR